MLFNGMDMQYVMGLTIPCCWAPRPPPVHPIPFIILRPMLLSGSWFALASLDVTVLTVTSGPGCCWTPNVPSWLINRYSLRLVMFESLTIIRCWVISKALNAAFTAASLRFLGTFSLLLALQMAIPSSVNVVSLLWKINIDYRNG